MKSFELKSSQNKCSSATDKSNDLFNRNNCTFLPSENKWISDERNRKLKTNLTKQTISICLYRITNEPFPFS